MQDRVFRAIAGILSGRSPLKPPVAEITLEADLQADLHLDAIDITMLAMMLEDDLDIGIADEEINGWGTVGDIVQSIVNRRIVS